MCVGGERSAAGDEVALSLAASSNQSHRTCSWWRLLASTARPRSWQDSPEVVLAPACCRPSQGCLDGSNACTVLWGKNCSNATC